MPKMTCRGARMMNRNGESQGRAALGLGRMLFGPPNAGRRPTAHSMDRPDYWFTRFSKLRVDRARGDPAPHRPLLLLVLCNLLGCGSLLPLFPPRACSLGRIDFGVRRLAAALPSVGSLSRLKRFWGAAAPLLTTEAASHDQRP